ncbi:hypothetical protein ACIRBX_35315 [Kitasatospora sp. NPDC096147]|uniref:hypothetical protein n=1 Tax=Kitasatospora sp. NPDC096147 TaxID=3364093 RepID=UPI0037F86F8D
MERDQTQQTAPARDGAGRSEQEQQRKGGPADVRLRCKIKDRSHGDFACVPDPSRCPKQ